VSTPKDSANFSQESSRPVPVVKKNANGGRCVWCGAQIGPFEGGPDEGMPRICDACASFFAGRQRMPLEEFVETLPHPVVVVDGDAVALAANGRLGQALHKSSEAIIGHRAGEIIECIHAREPAGCGFTVHCKGCAIRRAVTHTHATGERQEKVVAYQDVVSASGIRRMWFEIATERMGHIVIVRIDEIGYERRT
jgi:PAS domain-containing protein